MSNKKLTFSDFKRELPKKVAECKPDEKIQIAVTVDGLTAKALYSSIGDVSRYIQHCIRETVWREGGMLTVDGIVSSRQIAVQFDKSKKVSKDSQNIFGDGEQVSTD